MSFIEKLTEYLLKKQWVIFCLSILVGFWGYYLLPSDFVDKMPFSSRDWNVIACIVLLSIVAYLVFSLLRHLFSKVSAGRIRSKNRKYYARQDRAAEEENIDDVEDADSEDEEEKVDDIDASEDEKDDEDEDKEEELTDDEVLEEVEAKVSELKAAAKLKARKKFLD